MNPTKLNSLKAKIKLKRLAELAEISPIYLSNVLNNREKPSKMLMEKLTLLCNQLTFSEDYLPEDFKKHGK